MRGRHRAGGAGRGPAAQGSARGPVRGRVPMLGEGPGPGSTSDTPAIVRRGRHAGLLSLGVGMMAVMEATSVRFAAAAQPRRRRPPAGPTAAGVPQPRAWWASTARSGAGPTGRAPCRSASGADRGWRCSPTWSRAWSWPTASRAAPPTSAHRDVVGGRRRRPAGGVVPSCSRPGGASGRRGGLKPLWGSGPMRVRPPPGHQFARPVRVRL